jgi:hypothetical protein
MSNIFKNKNTSKEVNMIHMGKMAHTNETVVIFELEEDKTIMVMTLNEFNHDYGQNDYEQHDHYTHTGNDHAVWQYHKFWYRKNK